MNLYLEFKEFINNFPLNSQYKDILYPTKSSTVVKIIDHKMIKYQPSSSWSSSSSSSASSSARTFSFKSSSPNTYNSFQKQYIHNGYMFYAVAEVMQIGLGVSDRDTIKVGSVIEVNEYSISTHCLRIA